MIYIYPHTRCKFNDNEKNTTYPLLGIFIFLVGNKPF